MPNRRSRIILLLLLLIHIAAFIVLITGFYLRFLAGNPIGSLYIYVGGSFAVVLSLSTSIIGLLRRSTNTDS